MSDDDWRRSRRSRGRRGGAEHDFPPDLGAPSPFPATSSPAQRPWRDASPQGSESGAIVKRFDAGRGFGFVGLDGGGDAFLHVTVLQRTGAQTVAPGTRMRVRWGQGQKGPQVVEVLEIGAVEDVPQDRGYAPPERGYAPAERGYAPAERHAAAPRPMAGSGADMRGTVKWYSAEKGFGFVTPEDGGRDVFVHATALERSGVPPLAEGQAVTMRVIQGRKGPEAESVTID